MSKIFFKEYQRRQLEDNPNVASISERAIQYKADFKIRVMEENLSGKRLAQIFIENGFDLAVIGFRKAKSSLHRWRKIFEIYGEEGFRVERYGKGSTGRLSTKDIPKEKKLEKAEARIKYLEAELELVKS
ncbi:hypothetical protein [Planococcus lenghuensis]|uniref:hypothetical protein n=1 Tax=Planococcus lenghuensis TaxID=2213202 RepID=UPI0012EB56C7|nr:hypothetical protein [Planococcus lenghuensis]